MATKLSKFNEGHLEFAENMVRRLRSGSCQFLIQSDREGTKRIRETLNDFQDALRDYRLNKQGDPT